MLMYIFYVTGSTNEMAVINHGDRGNDNEIKR